MVKKVTKINLIIMSIFLISLVSANGLAVVGDNNFVFNKTTVDNIAFNFTLQNQEPYTFKNISFEDNPYVKMDTISEIQNGQNMSVNATIIGKESFNGPIAIKGFYLSNVGQLNQTHTIYINFDSGINPCSISIPKGDKVIFINQVADDITLKNSQTNEVITTINEGDNYTMNFDTPEVFSYYFERHGFLFTDYCTIASLETTGLINDPNLDAHLNLNLEVNYPKTNISTTFLIDSYKMNFYDSQSDVFSIKNIGTNAARNVELSGDWFSFSKNNFDLNPEESTTVSYTITPKGIDNSNKTDMNYTKNLTIEGNFDTFNKNFTIYIKKAIITNTTGSGSIVDVLKNMLDSYCKLYPNDPLCTLKSSVVVNNQSAVDTHSLSNMLKGLADAFFNYQDSQKITNGIQNDKINQINIKQNKTTDSLGRMENKINDMQNNMQKSEDWAMASAISIPALIICIILAYLIYTKKRGKKIKHFDSYK